MHTGLIALIIVLVVIALCIKTKKSLEFVIAGSIASAVVLYKGAFVTEWVMLFQEVMGDGTSVWLFLVTGLFGSLIALLQASRGTNGFSVLIEKLCNTQKKTLVTTFILGILIFIDDYLNILSIGVCMKKVYDKRKIPREALAYIIDSTGAPVCVLLPISTWAIFLAAVLYENPEVAALGLGSATDTYVAAIPFVLYPIMALLVVLLFSLGIIPKLGAMKAAFKRVEETGKLYSDDSKKFNLSDDEPDQKGNMIDFILPMGVVVAIALLTGDMVYAVLVALAVCFILYVPRKVVSFNDFFPIAIAGMADMLPTVCVVLCSFVWERLLGTMGIAEFAIDVVTPVLINFSPLFPAIVFIVVAFLTFTTSSLWGVAIIATPIVMPLAAAVDVNILLIMGAVIGGSAFGSHACFYCDATLLASKSSGIDNIEHAVSQLPYVIIASVLSIIGYLVLGFVM